MNKKNKKVDSITGAEDSIIETEDSIIETEDSITKTEDSITKTEDSIIETEDSIVGTEDKPIRRKLPKEKARDSQPSVPDAPVPAVKLNPPLEKISFFLTGRIPVTAIRILGGIVVYNDGMRFRRASIQKGLPIKVTIEQIKEDKK